LLLSHHETEIYSCYEFLRYAIYEDKIKK